MGKNGTAVLSRCYLPVRNLPRCVKEGQAFEKAHCMSVLRITRCIPALLRSNVALGVPFTKCIASVERELNYNLEGRTMGGAC